MKTINYFLFYRGEALVKQLLNFKQIYCFKLID